MHMNKLSIYLYILILYILRNYTHLFKIYSYVWDYFNYTGSFTQITYERPGDRRLPGEYIHQGGCQNATKYKHKCSRFISELFLIKK